MQDPVSAKQIPWMLSRFGRRVLNFQRLPLHLPAYGASQCRLSQSGLFRRISLRTLSVGAQNTGNVAAVPGPSQPPNVDMGDSSPLNVLSPELIRDFLNSAAPDPTAGMPTWLVDIAHGMQSYLQFLHTHTHAPWWLTLVIATVSIRIALFPVNWYQLRKAGEAGRLGPHMELLQQSLSRSDLSEKDKKVVIVRVMGKLAQRYNVQRWKMALPALVQLPAFIIFAIGCRSLVATNPDFLTGGALWFQNLTLRDPYYVLNIASIATSYLALMVGLLSLPVCIHAFAEMQQGRSKGSEAVKAGAGFYQQLLDYFGMIMVLSLPLTLTMPAGICMYWLPSALWTLVWVHINKKPDVRRVLGAAPPPRSVTAEDRDLIASCFPNNPKRSSSGSSTGNGKAKSEPSTAATTQEPYVPSPSQLFDSKPKKKA